MLQVRDLDYSIGTRRLLSGIQWIINPAKRVALIGPNGAGKTTLLRILNGEITEYRGTIIKPKDFRIGYLPQEEIAFGKGTILETVLEGSRQIMELEIKINELRVALNASNQNEDDLLRQLGTFEHQYEILGGYQIEAKAKSILSGLGFSETDFALQLSDLSGGWRMRVYLARLLIQKPDLLLLDEPTNHLDLPSLEWLEQYLLNFQGSMVIVSHDRFFIDRLSQEIFELDRGRLTHYPGNYHFYEEKKEERENQARKRYEELQAERERQQRFIDRFRYKATKAAQVQSRIKVLEKIETIDLPPPARSLNFKLSVAVPSYNDVVHIENMSFRYDEEWVLDKINLNIYRGEKIALVGANGAGKTTLTRLITRQVSPQIGIVRIGQRTVMGYYAQHQVDTLNLTAIAYDEVASTVAEDYIPRIRDVLGMFQFHGDDVFKKIEVLSGGEKARVSLAKILLSPVNFLIMDEPTNHLDMASKEALEHALADYDGTLLLISHDRYFLDKLVTRILEIHDHHIKEYEGNYSSYLAKRQAEPEPVFLAKEKTQLVPGSRKSKEQKRLEAEARQAVSNDRNRLTKEIDSLERKIQEFEQKKSEIEMQLARPETYQNSELARSLPHEYNRVKQELQHCYDRWAEAQHSLEDLMRRIV